jgi:hypothetical protein
MMPPNTPANKPAEMSIPIASPDTKLNTLARQIALADPNKPKPPLEVKPGEPFPPENTLPKAPTSVPSPDKITPAEWALTEVKEWFAARMRDMWSQFGEKIVWMLDTSGDAIKKWFTSVTGIFGVVKSTEWLKWKSENISAWLCKDGMFQSLCGGKDGWLSKILLSLLGVAGMKSAAASTVETVTETVKDMGVWYTATVKIIRKFFLWVEYQKGGELYSMDSFSSKSYSQIDAIYKNRATVSLRKAFDIPDSVKVDEKELAAALACIVDPQSKKWTLFRKQLDRSLSGVDYQKFTMHEVLTKMANPLSYMNVLANIDIVRNPTEMFDNLGFDIAEDGKATGELAGKTAILSLSAKKVLLVSAFAGNKFTNAKAWLDALKSTPEWKKMTPTDLKEYEKIFLFWEAFRSKVLGNPQIHLGLRSSFEEAFDKKGLSIFGITSLYCMMDGKADFENMTAIEKLAFYGGCASIASDLDSSSKWEFATTYIKAISSTDSNIPQDVKDIWWEFLSWIPQKAGSALWESLKFLWGAVKWAPEYALGALVLWYWAGKVRRAKHNWLYH